MNALSEVDEAASAESGAAGIGDHVSTEEPAATREPEGSPTVGGEALLDAPGLDASVLDAEQLAGVADEESLLDAPGMDASLFDAEQLTGGGGALLSAEESEALFQAIRSGGVARPATRPADLGSVDEPMRRVQHKLDDLAPSAIAQLHETLLRAGTVADAMEAAPCAITPLGTVLRSVAPGSAVWVVRADGDVVARIVMDAALAGALLERRLGASAAVPPGRQPERPHSALELRLVEPIARAACERLVAPFAHGPLTLSGAGRETELGSPLAPCATVRFTLTPRRGSPTEILVTLLASSLGHAVAPVRIGATVADGLADIEVEVVAVLGRCASNVRALIALERGSVLRLDGAPERPIELRVDGMTVLHGNPVVREGNLAIEVSS